MDNLKLKEIENNLSITLKKYIDSITREYGAYIPKERLNFLKNITDYSSIIKVYDYGTVNAMANRKMISMPICADKILNKISKIPGYGINKNHQSYDKNEIVNNNTFINYLYHVFISGTDAEGYYNDMLLHETMHFCGSGGGSALKEGINEFLTRKIAHKNGFRTNGCGYPKEVKIAYELQNIFTEEVLNQIAFINSFPKICDFLDKTLGNEASKLYQDVTLEMEREFEEKYYSKINSYNGFKGIFQKTLNYYKIDYSNVYRLLENYKNREKENSGIRK